MEVDKELQFAFRFITRETNRIMNGALLNGRMTRSEWDIVNKLLEVYSEPIREAWMKEEQE